MNQLNNKAKLKQSRQATADARASAIDTLQTTQRARQHQPTTPDAPDASVAAVTLGLPRSAPVDRSPADRAPTRGVVVAAASLIVGSRTDSAAVLTHGAAVVNSRHSSRGESQLDAFSMFNALSRVAAPPGKRAMQSTRAEASSLNQSDAALTAVMLGSTAKRISGLKGPTEIKPKQTRSKSASNGNRGSQPRQTSVPSSQASVGSGRPDTASELDGSIARRQQRLADRRQKLKAMGRSTGIR